MLEIFNIATVGVANFGGLNPQAHSLHQSTDPVLWYHTLTYSHACHGCAEGAKPEAWAQKSISLPTKTGPESSLTLGMSVKCLI